MTGIHRISFQPTLLSKGRRHAAELLHPHVAQLGCRCAWHITECSRVWKGSASASKCDSQHFSSLYCHPLLYLSTFSLTVIPNSPVDFICNSTSPFLELELSLIANRYIWEQRALKVMSVGYDGSAFSKAKCDQTVESLDLFSAPASSQPRMLWPQLCPFATAGLFQILSASCSGTE